MAPGAERRHAGQVGEGVALQGSRQEQILPSSAAQLVSFADLSSLAPAMASRFAPLPCCLKPATGSNGLVSTLAGLAALPATVVHCHDDWPSSQTATWSA